MGDASPEMFADPKSLTLSELSVGDRFTVRTDESVYDFVITDQDSYKDLVPARVRIKYRSSDEEVEQSVQIIGGCFSREVVGQPVGMYFDRVDEGRPMLYLLVGVEQLIATEPVEEIIR